MGAGEETLRSLTEDERHALRGSKFAPLPSPSPSSSRQKPRFAHPGGPLTTNKAAALAKFLERKLQQPDGLNALDLNHVELAVKNAKQTVIASKASSSATGIKIRHVSSFQDSSENSEEITKGEENGKKKKKKKYEEVDKTEGKQTKKKKKKKKKRKSSPVDSTEEQKKKRRKRCAEIYD